MITAIELIEHLYNPDNLIEESYRCLKPGGFLVITTPNLASWLNRILLLFGYLPMEYEVSVKYFVERRPFQRYYQHYGHVRLFTVKALQHLLEAVGFEVVKVVGESLPYTQRFLLTKLLDKLFSNIPSLSSGIIVLARKP